MEMMYNEEYVMEKNKLEVELKLMKNEGCDIFVKMGKKKRKKMRKMVIEMVI